MDDAVTRQMAEFRDAWARCFAEDGSAVPVSLEDSPVYPLARTVEMPPDHPYPTGAIGLQMVGLRLHGMERLAEARREAVADGVRLNLAVEGVRLRGTYRLEAKPDPILDLDTAGNLMDLRPEALRPAAAGADSTDTPLDPQKEEWLDTARDQRQKLGETPNGLRLMALYNQHNEVYEEVFRTSPTLPANWKANGVTKAMASDTNAAVKSDAVVNSSSKDYGGGVTYNSNAFVQQLNVAVESMIADPNFDLMTPPTQQNLTGRYWDAAKAALSFGKGVNSTTGNAKDSVHEMKPGEVYGTVDAQKGDLPPVSDPEAKNVLASAMSSGSGGADEQPLPGWIVIDEDDRRRVRSIVAHRAKARAENATVRGEALFTGEVSADIGRVEAVVDLRLDAAGEVRAAGARIDLPAFALEIDDAAWTGSVAAVARQRLAGMLFIRSLLHESLDHRLRAAVREAAVRAHSAAAGAA